MKKHHDTRAEDRIPIGRKIAVGAGGFPFQNGGLIVQYMAQPIFQIFLGLNPALFGLAMTIPRIWDAFTDPIMGRISDRLKTTPKKAIGYIIAGQVFRELPRGLEFSTRSDYEDLFNGVALSFEHDLSMAYLNDCFYYSGELSWCPIKLPEAPQKIIGYGSSPLVACESRGLYFIQVDDHAVQIELYPQARSVRDAWQWYADGELVTELDAETAVSFRLKLPGYQPIELHDIPGTYSFPLVRKTDGISVN